MSLFHIDWDSSFQWKTVAKLISILLLEEVANAELYLWTSILFLTGLLLLQTYAFSRPRPVPSKLLPRRPGIQILFKQDGHNVNTSSTNENFFNANLPDSFAPLLSSSDMEIIQTDITADLLHAFEFEASASFKKGKHIIPLNKDSTRPQLTVDLDRENNQAFQPDHNENGKIDHRIDIHCLIGSGGFTSQEDFLVNIPTTSRSQPMLKSAIVTLDPPLPLLNVAPTLIHIPTLFQDNMVPLLTRRLAVRLLINFFSSFSNFLERLLWNLESKCKIHLSKVHFTPIYQGQEKHLHTSDSSANTEPQWSVKLSFSGKILLFDMIPIPFFFITLPTFIIPAPHALLHKLLTRQPLASGTINHDNINQEKILLSIIDSIHTWKVQMKALLTPPAVGADLTLPGGLSIAVETMLGRDLDPSSNMNMKTSVASPMRSKSGFTNLSHSEGTMQSSLPRTNSETSMSTLTSIPEDQHLSQFRSKRHRNLPSVSSRQRSNSAAYSTRVYDANEMIPWFLSISAEGEILKDKILFNLEKASAIHHAHLKPHNNLEPDQRSQISVSGDLIIQRQDTPASFGHNTSSGYSTPPRARINSKDDKFKSPTSPNISYLKALPIKALDPPSITAILLFPKLFPQSSIKKRYGAQTQQPHNNFLQYDYAFEINENSKIDAISLSVGASHPLLNGGTMIATVLESIYAHGYIGARENATINPYEMRRKRNILKHLPAVDFSCGIGHLFIPEESCSYSDDGQNMCLPELNGGRMTIRVVGGYSDVDDDDDVSYQNDEYANISGPNGLDYQKSLKVKEGIKMIMDFGVSSFTLNNECPIREVSVYARNINDVIIQITQIVM